MNSFESFLQRILTIGLLITSSILFAQTNASIQHDGETRTFVYYTPSGWNVNQQLPVLYVLHGLTQTGAGVMNITDFNTIAEDNNFIVCYPDGMNNAFNANMNLTVSSADDLGFMEALVVYFEQNLNTDPLRRYLCGFSNGGFMSHKLACESSFCFAAIATVAGNMSDTVFANCSPNHLTSVLHIHGTGDPVVSYNGSASTGESVDAVMEKWRTFLNCDLSPSMTTKPNNNVFDLSYPEKYTYTSCGNYSLELIKIINGGHQWPGIATLVGGLGNINMDFYSPQTIWDFLANKSCPNTVSAVNTPETLFKVYPNPTSDCIYVDIDDFTGNISLELFDLQGKFLTSSSNNNLLLSGYSPGAYILKLKYGEIIKKQMVFKK